MEQALLQARTLIESTVVLHRRRSVGDTVPVARTGSAHLGESVERLIARGHHAVSVTLVGHGEFTESVLRVLGENPGRAVVRVLCTAEIAPDVAERLAGLPIEQIEQTEVRVSDSDLRAVLVVDGFTALMPANCAGGGEQFAVVNDMATVRALELLFAGTWGAARRLADHLRLSPRLRLELVRKILERLRAGHTDEAAAHEINVSLRTYRRYVAEILRDLDAISRFQAGARAVQLGLLPA
ncbi:helix-turn-helix domain-containing protein [Streptomyces californicus]|uniref:LuxR family transcriptional regulator n=1 Tax=Streptomyces californicus TaxID=67351 RepID=UPI00099B83EC|nr:LuxR family transcriptional regulator [Streptomyces californicus]QRV53387.1 DNA-binding response regulator [Streptomyces californicus]